MDLRWLLLIPSFLTLSCERAPKEEPPPPAVNVILGEPYFTADADLDQSMQQARATFGDFLAESVNDQSAGSAFMIKIHVTEGALAEDIWVSNAQPAPDDPAAYTAIVDTMPEALLELAMSEEIRFSLNEVVEWQYFEDNKVIGAHATRVLRSRMDEAARTAHDSLYPFPFD